MLTDFDGTLAPIVDDPTAAAPLPGVPEVLALLHDRYAVVAVVSGRPVDYLRRRLGDELRLSGLYGLERFEGGTVVSTAGADRWRPVVATSVARAEAELGSIVEDKGLSLTLHFRTAPGRSDEVCTWADGEAARSGLVVRNAKSSLELHPPVPADKGSVVRELSAGLGAVCFLGDDVGDLPAYDALDALAAQGVHTVRIAVRTEESPAEVLSRADIVVDSPHGALVLLESLAC